MLGHGSGMGQARGVLKAWILWERFSNRLWPMRPIPHAKYELLRFRLVRYRGPEVVLRDGTSIHAGDVVGEIHCDNPAMSDHIRQGRMNHYRACRCDLKNLANWSVQAREALPVKAFYGVTMVWWAAARLGFEVHERKRVLRNRFDRIYMAGLLLVYSNDRAVADCRGSTLSGRPREVWLSRAELIRRYAETPLEMRPSKSD